MSHDSLQLKSNVNVLKCIHEIFDAYIAQCHHLSPQQVYKHNNNIDFQVAYIDYREH